MNLESKTMNVGKYKRELWIDSVKVLACLLVVGGHLYQSLAESNIMQNGILYNQIIKSLYYFHVYLFFICSGYLYQKRSCVNTWASYGKNVLKKTIALGIPYVFFSFVTWVLKIVMADSVNTQVESLFAALFYSPISVYWYLYTLILIFLITPTFKNRKQLTIALILSFIIKITVTVFHIDIYPVSITLKNAFWFILGMYFTLLSDKQRVKSFWGYLGMLIFIIGCGVIYSYDISSEIPGILLGILMCCSIILIVTNKVAKHGQSKFAAFISKYTLPIFLMHTLMAAPVRIILVKIGVTNSILHIIIGLLISLLGPIAAAEIMKKLKWPDFVLNPTRFIKLK